MRLLIFGSNGFVGPYLAKEFHAHGYSVFGADVAEKNANPYCEGYASCNLLEPKTVLSAIKEFQPTHIINLAAISSVALSWKNPELTQQVNVGGTKAIFDACVELGLKPEILLIGSSEEYAPSSTPLNEESPVDATNPYGKSKAEQERLAESYRKEHGLSVHCVRSFNHIGVGQLPKFVIPSWAKQIADIARSGKPGVLKVGNVSVVRDFTDVRDVAVAYRLVLEKGDPKEIYNIGSGSPCPLKEVLSTLLSFAPVQIEVEVDPNLLRPTDNPFIVCDPTKIETQLGWKRQFDRLKSLKAIYDSFYNE